MSEEKTENELKYPGVARAYDFVLPSYQMLAARFEAADGRITAAMGLAATLTLGAPIFAKSIRPDISFGSRWFLLAVIAFIAAYILGLLGRIKGKLTLPDPGVHYGESLHRDDWTFKKNAIYFAGKHFESNAEAVRVKGNFSMGITACLFIEVMLLVTWIAR